MQFVISSQAHLAHQQHHPESRVDVQPHVLLQCQRRSKRIATNLTLVLINILAINMRAVVIHQTLAHKERLATDVTLKRFIMLAALVLAQTQACLTLRREAPATDAALERLLASVLTLVYLQIAEAARHVRAVFTLVRRSRLVSAHVRLEASQ